MQRRSFTGSRAMLFGICFKGKIMSRNSSHKTFVSFFCCLMLCAFSISTATAQTGDYRLGVEDEIEITVRNHEYLNRTVTIRPDGKISFPTLGDMTASGKTTSQLASAIQKELDKTLNRARVSVTLKTVRSRRARISGAVTKPGAYDIKPGWRVMDLVAVAEGLTTKPVRIQGRVVREGEAIPFSVSEASSQPQSGANVLLQPDDLVMLDATDIRNALHVVGQVARPGAFDLEEGINPVTLIATAGGITPGAALRRAHVLRGSEKIALDLEAVLIDGARDPRVLGFTFLAGDVLVIPENSARVGIMGNVARPAYYPLPEKTDDASILKMLALAGGQLEGADLKHATLTRMENGQSTVIPVDITAIMNGTAPDTIRLRADDVLHLPKFFNQVHVIGQVEKPGVYDLKNGLTLMSLLSEAGNARPSAHLSRAYVLRDGKQIPFDLHAAITEGEADPATLNFAFLPGDVLVIPENQLRFGVMGQVTRPGFYPFPESGEVNVLEALGVAGGQIPQGDQRGNLREAGIIRTVDGKATVIPINIEQILSKGKTAQNIQLQPKDVLYVPPQKKGFKWTDVIPVVGGLVGIFR